MCREDGESARPQVVGLVVRELARLHSNNRAYTDLSAWLADAGVPGLQGIDTRALVRRLRMHGAMRGVIGCDPAVPDSALIEQARLGSEMAGRNLVAAVSAAGHVRRGAGEPAHRVVALDCGAKDSVYRHLEARGCEVNVSPYDLDAPAIRRLNPDGLFVSNGPGDPQAVPETIATLGEVALEYPTFGICLGHQLLAVALGAKTFKLKFGHRGVNQPVRNRLTGRVEITSQNHGFCVDAATLASIDCEVTHLHLNDGTVAGLRHRTRPIFSVQYHPEASPGPHDAAYLFDCFIGMMRTGRPPDAVSMRRARQVATPALMVAYGLSGE